MDNSVTAAPFSLITALYMGGSSNLQSIIVNTDHLYAKPGINIRNLGVKDPIQKTSYLLVVTHSLPCPPPHPCITTHLLSVSLNLPILDT